MRAVRIDVANSRLRLIAPVIKDHGIDYERAHFERKVREGALSLRRTRAWLRAAVREEVASQRIALEDLTSKNQSKPAAFLAVLSAGAAALVTGAAAPRAADCPETLLLDVARLGALNAAFRAGVRAAAVLVLVAQRLAAAHERAPAPLLEEVAQRLLAAPAGGADAAAAAAVDALRGCEAMGEPERAALREVLLQGIGSDRPVPRLMEARLRNALRRPDGGAADIFRDVPATLAAYPELQLPPAARPLAPYLRDVVQRLRKVVRLSARVHAARYNGLIEGEAAGCVPSRARLEPGALPPPGFRLMQAREAAARLPELRAHGAAHLLGAAPSRARLNGGWLERPAAGEPRVVLAHELGAVEAAAGAAAAEALLVPLSPDKIPLAPGQAPPEGFRLLRAEEAAAERWRGALVAGWLEEWSIVRLEGGKIDGRGYGGGVTAGDFTQDQYIGEALVVPLAEETGEGSATP